MNRRQFLIVTAACAGTARVQAHHGWSSFDQDSPIYLRGTVREVKWANPHVELKIELPANISLPGDLATRNVPAQTSPVDATALLGKTKLPARKDRLWEIELAPLTRMEAWQVAPIAKGESIEVVGFTFPKQEGEAILRVEFLFRGGKGYGLRSSPA